MLSIIRCIITFFCVVAVSVAQAQYNHWTKLQYKKDRGLPNNLTKTIVQDSLGFIWVGTDAGIARLEGITFEPYQKGLSNQYVKSLIKRKNGSLIAITDMGVARVMSQLDTVHIHPLIAGTLHPTDTSVSFPKNAYEDSQQRLWIAERSSVVLLKDDGSLKRYEFDEQHRTYDFLNSFTFAESERGDLYVSSFPGFLLWYNPISDEFQEVPLPQPVGVAYQLIHVNSTQFLLAASEALFEIRVRNGELIRCNPLTEDGFTRLTKVNDQLLYGASLGEGIFKIKRQQQEYQVERTIAPDASIYHALYADANHNLWGATDKGIFLYPPAFFGNFKPKELPFYINAIATSTNGDTVFIAQGESIFFAHADSLRLLYSSTEGNILQMIPQKEAIWIATANEELLRLSYEGEVLGQLDFSAQQAVILSMAEDAQGNLWCVPTNSEGILKVSEQQEIRYYHEQEDGTNQVFNVVAVSSKNQVYIGGTSPSHYLLLHEPSTNTFRNLSSPLPPLKEPENFQVNDIALTPQGIYLGTNEGLLRYEKDSTKRVYLGAFSYENIKALTVDRAGNLWLGTGLGVIKFTGEHYVHFNDKNGLISEDITTNAMLVDGKNNLWIGTSSGVVIADELTQYDITHIPIVRTLGNDGQVLDTKQFSFELTSGTYLQEEVVVIQYPTEHLQYQFRLISDDRTDAEWSLPSREPTYFIPKLPRGNYVLEARARQQGNYIWSDSVKMRLQVSPPWYQTWWAIVGYVAGMILLIWAAVKWYTQRLVREKEKLEGIISKRTQEIVSQKEIIEKTNEEVTSSINYAKRMQLASLPTLAEMQEVFKDIFVFYRPRDIVSGDFYWFTRKGELSFLAAADCTGHGVPGAFMSIAGGTMLKNAVEFKGLTDPADILKDVHLNIRSSFKQDETQNRDGMDVALCVIDHQQKTLHFAGAQNYLLYIQNGKMERVRGDRQPVGGQQREKDRVFHTKSIDISSPTTFYIFSDGYQDQFGGPEEKKFMAHRLRKILQDIHQKPMKDQQTMLNEVMEAWITESEQQRQTDDMLIVGVKV